MMQFYKNSAASEQLDHHSPSRRAIPMMPLTNVSSSMALRSPRKKRVLGGYVTDWTLAQALRRME
jgi:hypothetical protein